MAPETNRSLRAARAYVARGLRVFPLNGKLPATPNGCDDGSCDSEQIDLWFSRNRNIGIVAPPNVVILDIDPRHGGDNTLNDWCREHGAEWLWDVPRVRTGGGGLHYWFHYNGEKLKKSIDGIDFQRGNKYVVAPPSKTADEYQWEITLPEDLGDLPELPDWLLDLARRPILEPSARNSEYSSEDPLDVAVHKMTSMSEVLSRNGWALVAGDGDGDGSKWRHPTSENEFSATMRHGCLFVYSDTPGFPVTEEDDPHGVTLFSAVERLDFANDRAALIRSLKNRGLLVDEGVNAILATPRPQPEVPAPKSAETPTSPLGQSWGDDWSDWFTPTALTAAPTASEHPGGDDPGVDSTEPEADEASLDGDEDTLRLNGYLDWAEAFAADDDIEQRWLVEPLIAIGRAHSLFALAKTGKSMLLLPLAAALASGRPFLGMPEHDPVPVLYLDYEMTRDDVVERLRLFDYAPADLDLLHYTLLASGDGLDTYIGGQEVVHDAETLGVGLVIVDTLSRAVAGPEDKADTIRAFYNFTGSRLKRMGISVVRLDHGGKDLDRGARGSSAKNEDVDVVYKFVSLQDSCFNIETTHQRMGWIEKKIELRLDTHAETGNLSWTRRSEAGYPPRTKETVTLLEELNVPVSVGKEEARRLLKEGGWKGRDTLLLAALRFRNEQAREAASIEAVIGQLGGTPVPDTRELDPG